MTYKQAVERLKQLAEGRDWCLSHETSSYRDTIEIIPYIAGIGHTRGAKLYAQAIKNMEELLDIRATQVPDAPPEDEEAEI